MILGGGMSRKLSNWLQGYAELTEGTESPKVFHLWVALGTLAGAAQRKIHLDFDYYQVHTNMYITLVAPPGRARKSTALRIGKGLLKNVPDYGSDVYFSTQASSVAALIKQLRDITEKNKEHQSLTAFSSELGSLLGNKSIEMTDFLVDIYDCDPDWDKQTIGRGMEKIDKPWFNLIAATTPQWMGDNLSKTAVEGGFVARCIYVFDSTRLLVAIPKLTEEQKKIKKALIADLAVIASLKGKFKLSPEAEEFYTRWYEDVNRATSDTDLRISGYFERKHIHVLKVAMMVALSDGNVDHPDKFIIKVDDIGRAIDMLEELEPGMRRAFSGVGKNIYSSDLERIKWQIIESGEITYKQLLAANIHALEREQFDKQLAALVELGEVEREGLKFSAKGGNHARS